MAQFSELRIPLSPVRKTSWWERFLTYRAIAAERRALRKLSAERLADIGRTRVEAETEAARAPWDAPSHWKR